MTSCITASTRFLAILTLALVSCGDGQPESAPTSTPKAVQTISVPVPVPTPTPMSSETATSGSRPTYLTEEIPPCTPASGSTVDPCEPGWGPLGVEVEMIDFGDEPDGVEYFLEGTSEISVSHIVLRGTYLPGTVRCVSSDFRRPFPLSRWRQVLCFADVRVNNYVLGSGPSVLTVQVTHEIFWPPAEIEKRRLQWETTLVEGGSISFFDHLNPIQGREAILFLGPAMDISHEAWRVFWTWNVERRDDGTVIAVHPYLRYYSLEEHRPRLEMELPAFRQAVVTAHQERVTANGGRIRPDANLPMLVTDANRLREYFSDPKVGGYAPGVPTPAQPPPVPACANGMAVPNPSANRGFVHDCQSLLDARDALRGTASLNWDAERTVTAWEGVTTGGTPARVTRLELSNEELNGSIPMGLGRLFELTHLDLSGNSLTGTIPEQLDWLDNLQSIKLSGNSLTGCIPVALESVDTNDLSSLNLLYCQPPAPENLAAGTVGETDVPLTWDAVSNASKYRVEYRLAYKSEWTVDDDTLTATSHTVDGLACGSAYRFRVSAYGSGTVYAAQWSEPAAPAEWNVPAAAVAATTRECTDAVSEANPNKGHGSRRY